MGDDDLLELLAGALRSDVRQVGELFPWPKLTALLDPALIRVTDGPIAPLRQRALQLAVYADLLEVAESSALGSSYRLTGRGARELASR